MNKMIIIIGLVLSSTFMISPFVLYYGNDFMIVTSDSMIPTLNPNDLLIVQKTDIDYIKVNDIVVFDSHIEGIGIVAHRAIEKFDDGGKIRMYTQGDNVDEKDTWVVYDEDVIGKVVDNIPFVGILLIEPVRYSLVAVIIITTASLLKEITSEIKLQKNRQKQ